MIEKYFSAPKTLVRLRAGISGHHIDEFAGALKKQGYAHTTAIRYLRAAAHLGYFVQRKGGTLADVDGSVLEAFVRHLSHCRCPQSNDEKTGFHPSCGVKLFYQHLVQRGICRDHPADEAKNNEPALVTAFRDWFQVHRGVTQPTLRQYTRGATELLHALGMSASGVPR